MTVISTDVDKQLLASENDVTMGHFSLLYTAPTVVAVAIDEAHCVFKW